MNRLLLGLLSVTLVTGCLYDTTNPLFCDDGNCDYDVIAACSTDGNLVGIKHGTYELSTPGALGFRPQTMARMGDVMLVADVDRQLRQVRISDFRPVGAPEATGESPNFILANADHAFLVNSLGNTLQVFARAEALSQTTGPTGDDGVGLATVGQLYIGDNSSPQAIARIGDVLYVTLGGGYTDDASIAAGQKVAKVNVSDPANPTLVGTIELSGLDLKSPSVETVARPGAIIVRNEKLYLTLGNTAKNWGDPDGPPLLAVIDPQTDAVSTIDLDAEHCSGPLGLAIDGENLFVTCFGKATYKGPPDFEFESIEKTGVLMLDGGDEVVARYAPTTGDTFAVASRATVFDHHLYLGDQNGGRVYVLDTREGKLVEKAVLDACPPQSKPFSNVLDLIALP